MCHSQAFRKCITRLKINHEWTARATYFKNFANSFNTIQYNSFNTIQYTIYGTNWQWALYIDFFMESGANRIFARVEKSRTKERSDWVSDFSTSAKIRFPPLSKTKFIYFMIDVISFEKHSGVAKLSNISNIKSN